MTISKPCEIDSESREADGPVKPILDRLSALIRFPSVSSSSNHEVSLYVAGELESLGFDVELSKYEDPNGVHKYNVIGKRAPAGFPDAPTSNEYAAKQSNVHKPFGVAYFAHTDVVPTEGWHGHVSKQADKNTMPSPGIDSDPFEPVLDGKRVYGRGACDMKGSLATMISAVARVDPSEQTTPIWIACTADEEVGFDGAREMVATSAMYRDLISHQPLAIIGEPTSLQVVHAHKGIQGFRIIAKGKAAHSSTDDGVNANESMIPVINLLQQIGQRTRNDPRHHDARFSPPHLSWNYGFSDGMTAINITPPRCVAWASFRTMPTIDGSNFVAEIKDCCDQHGLEFQPYAGGDPVWVDPTASFITDLATLTQTDPKSVCYGTDGGEYCELDHRVVLGPGSIEQAHKPDEWISLDQLIRGTDLYEEVIRRYACSRNL